MIWGTVENGIGLVSGNVKKAIKVLHPGLRPWLVHPCQGPGPRRPFRQSGDLCLVHVSEQGYITRVPYAPDSNQACLRSSLENVAIMVAACIDACVAKAWRLRTISSSNNRQVGRPPWRDVRSRLWALGFEQVRLISLGGRNKRLEPGVRPGWLVASSTNRTQERA